MRNERDAPAVVVLRRHPADAWWLRGIVAGWAIVLVVLVVTAFRPTPSQGDDLAAFAAPLMPLFVALWGFGGLIVGLHPGFPWRAGREWEVAHDVNVEDAAEAVLHVAETDAGGFWEPMWVRVVPEESARTFAAAEASAQCEEREASRRAAEQRVEEERRRVHREAAQRSRAIERAAGQEAV